MKLTNIPLALAVALAMTACGNDKKTEQTATATPVTADGLKIAYVDMDTLQEKYQFYIDGKNALEKKVEAYQATVRQKETALQQTQENIQKRMQQGQITTEAQYNAEVNKFNQQQNAYAQFRSTNEQELAKEQEDFGKALQDSLDNFLVEYNKTKKYHFILNKAVMLHAEKSYDITAEVVAGLNKRYTKNKSARNKKRDRRLQN